MALVDVLARKRRLNAEDFGLVLNVNSQRDYMLLNYMEQQVAKSQGEQFLIQSSDKIQYIMGLHIGKICSKSTLMSYLDHLEMVISLFIESLPLALCLWWILKRYDLICPSSYFQLR